MFTLCCPADGQAHVGSISAATHWLLKPTDNFNIKAAKNITKTLQLRAPFRVYEVNMISIHFGRTKQSLSLSRHTYAHAHKNFLLEEKLTSQPLWTEVVMIFPTP